MAAPIHRSAIRSLLLVVGLGLALSTSFQAAAQDSTPSAVDPGTAAPSNEAVMGYADLVAQLEPAVVTVINLQQLPGFGEAESQRAGAGTGFIIDTDGHIVTNYHVVEGGDEFQVILADGTSQPATLVGVDPFTDLAMVQIEGEVPATVAFGDSDALRPGQPVLAIGSALGTFTSTVTDGIISAIGRDFPELAAQQSSAIYSDLIQHNADINPGNSGGPLFDLNGNVVGVNTLGISVVPGQGTPAQGLYFAIPSNTVKHVADQLIANGEVAYPYLGVTVETVTPELASQYNLPVQNGAFVTAVSPGSPAAEAGIEAEDFITAIDGTAIDAENSFAELLLLSHAPGETIDITIVRGTEEQTVDVTLGSRDDIPAVPAS